MSGKEREVYGVVFPKDPATKKVSTSKTGTEIFAAAARTVDFDLAARIAGERDWRHKYPRHLTALTEASLKCPEAALAIAQAGLECARKAFRFVPRESPASGVTLDRIATLARIAPDVTTTTVKGTGQLPSGLSVTTPTGETLLGEDMLALLRKWSNYGACEPSVLDSVTALNAAGVAALQPYFQNHVFVLLGATSAMGPAETLLSLGATVVALSRPGTKATSLVGRASISPGQLVLPVLPEARAKLGSDITDEDLWAVAGADIMEHLPTIIKWLQSLFPDKHMVIGSYIYLDSDAHVRATMAMDTIIAEVMQARGNRNVSLAYIGSPATAYVIPEEAYEDSAARYASRPLWHIPLGLKKNNRPMVEGTNYTGAKVAYAMTDGFSVFQGPNYALAKGLQLWRAVLAWEAGRLQREGRAADGSEISVSINMAPPCRTESVVHSRTAAIGIEGMSAFAPLLAFDSCTISGIMTYLLLDDLLNSERRAPLNNPLELVVHNAFAGGGPRCAYQNDSIGYAAYAFGLAGYSFKP